MPPYAPSYRPGGNTPRTDEAILNDAIKSGQGLILRERFHDLFKVMMSGSQFRYPKSRSDDPNKLILYVELVEKLAKTCNAFKYLPVDKIVEACLTQGKMDNAAREPYDMIIADTDHSITSSNLEEMLDSLQVDNLNLRKLREQMKDTMLIYYLMRIVMKAWSKHVGAKELFAFIAINQDYLARASATEISRSRDNYHTTNVRTQEYGKRLFIAHCIATLSTRKMEESKSLMEDDICEMFSTFANDYVACIEAFLQDNSSVDRRCLQNFKIHTETARESNHPCWVIFVEHEVVEVLVSLNTSDARNPTWMHGTRESGAKRHRETNDSHTTVHEGKRRRRFDTKRQVEPKEKSDKKEFWNKKKLKDLPPTVAVVTAKDKGGVSQRKLQRLVAAAVNAKLAEFGSGTPAPEKI